MCEIAKKQLYSYATSHIKYNHKKLLLIILKNIIHNTN